jgi:hypothetical protein
MGRKGNCIECGTTVEMADAIEVVGEGFTCSVKCSEIVELAARETASDKAAWYDMDR